MAKSKNFEDYVRLSLKMFGEEMIRRSEELELGGLDACADIHIEYDIPSWNDEIDFPKFSITFECYNQTEIDAFINSPEKFMKDKEEN